MRRRQHFADITIDDWRATIETNLSSRFLAATFMALSMPLVATVFFASSLPVILTALTTGQVCIVGLDTIPQILAQRYAPPRHRARCIAIYLLLGNVIGAGAGGVLIPWIAASFSTDRRRWRRAP